MWNRNANCANMHYYEENVDNAVSIVCFRIVLYEWSFYSIKVKLVDPASSHMLVLKIKPCMFKFIPKNGETANGSLNQL